MGWCSLTGNLAPDHSVEQKVYLLWNKLETCFWLFNSNRIQVNWCFPSSFPGSRIRLMGKWKSLHGTGSFWTAKCALLPNQATQTPEGPTAHTLQAQLRQASSYLARGETLANSYSQRQDNSWRQKSISPGSLQTRPLRQTAKSKLPPGHLLFRVRHWNHTDGKRLLPLYTHTQQCFCKPPKGG